MRLFHSMDLTNDYGDPISLKSNKKTKSLIDKCRYQKDRFAIKAAYIIRDTVESNGDKLGIPSVNFAFL
jgi:hypothetical protein